MKPKIRLSVSHAASNLPGAFMATATVDGQTRSLVTGSWSKVWGHLRKWIKNPKEQGWFNGVDWP